MFIFDFSKLIFSLLLLVTSAISASPLLISHRGDTKQHQQNTYPAILAAWQAGVDKVEIDIQATTDTIVVFHDKKVGKQRVDELNLKTLRETAGYSVPTLAEVLGHNRKISYLLDLKSTDTGFIEKLIEQIKLSRYPATQLSFQSNNIDVLTRIKATLHSDTYYLYQTPLMRPTQATLDKLANKLTAATITGISCKGRRYINKSFVTTFQKNNLSVFIWTTNKDERISHYKSIEVDGLITDNLKSNPLNISQSTKPTFHRSDWYKIDEL